MLEQTEYIPVLAFAVQPVCVRILEYFGDDIHEGDVFLHNDVFSGGNQNNDVAVFRPIFFDGELVAWAACKGHQADIGGAVQGGYNPEAREVWQEAFRIPPLKIYDKGQRRDDVWRLVFANVRLEIVEKDMEAQIGGTVVGERGIHSLLNRYGRPSFEAHKQYLFDATEKMVVSDISKIPDGEYKGESFAFYDGVHEGSKMKIALTVTVDGGAITFDFAGTSPQTEGFVNAPLGATTSAVLLTFLMLINPETPHNEGLTRPITVRAPEGSFLNASYPAATTFGNSLTGPISDAIFKAMSKALPQTVTAGWNRMLSFAVTGQDPRANGEKFVDILFISTKGGSGATHSADGYDHIGLINCAGGILAQDYEMLEIHNPFLLAKHQYEMDSAGAGQWRGGLGIETEILLEGDAMTGIAFGDGIEEEAKAFGLFGGGVGSLNKLTLNYPDGACHAPKSKEIVRGITKGAVFRQTAGGGGGYGDPLKRDAELVRQEVANQTLSVERARDVYGVVVEPINLTIDQNSTDSLREKPA